MPTQRKRWFRVADSLLRESWPRDAKLTMVLLQAWLNQRWARDGLSAEEACRATLSRGALAEITGRTQLRHAVSALRVLAECVSISIRVEGEYVEIHWPKFAEFQNLGARDRTEQGQKPPSPRRPRPRVPRSGSGESKTPPQNTEGVAPAGAGLFPSLEPPAPEPKPPDPRPPDPADQWPAVRAAFAAYGKGLSAALAAPRRTIMRARARDHPDRPEVLVELVHGYVAHHGIHSRGHWDPLRHLTPETVYRPSHAAKFLESFDEAIAAGRSPPFLDAPVADGAETQVLKFANGKVFHRDQVTSEQWWRLEEAHREEQQSA